jgi:predicted RNase H-like HicB family nuclease
VVLLREKDGRYSAIVPALGVASWGHDVPEALAMVVEAVELHLESIRDDEEPIPADKDTFTVEMGDATDGLIHKVRVNVPSEAQLTRPPG